MKLYGNGLRFMLITFLYLGTISLKRHPLGSYKSVSCLRFAIWTTVKENKMVVRNQSNRYRPRKLLYNCSFIVSKCKSASYN